MQLYGQYENIFDLTGCFHYNYKLTHMQFGIFIEGLAAEIKTPHYSRKTLKTYADWIRKVQSYLRNKPPEALGAMDVHPVREYFVAQLKYHSYIHFSGVDISRERVALLERGLHPLRAEQTIKETASPLDF